MRSIFFGSNVASFIGQAVSFVFVTFGSQIQEVADGILVLLNKAGTGFTRLCFGGTTAAFPSLSRAGSFINNRLADDSHYSSQRMGTVSLMGAAGADGAAVSLGNTTAATVGAAGAAAALPANPVGYLIINVAGTQMKLPYYNT
jgi:hypothetical protein